MSSRSVPEDEFRFRRRTIVIVFIAAAMFLAWKPIDIQLNDREFLQSHGDARHLRTEKIDARRGMVLDRNNEPLAVSTPSHSVWAHPDLFLEARDDWGELGRVLDMSVDHIAARVEPRRGKKFVYVKRHLTPEKSLAVRALRVGGLSLASENRRYYPTAEYSAHVVGFTNIDGQGQEGIELAFDRLLKGESGSRRVIKDNHGRVVEAVDRLRPMVPGKDIVLTIDRRVQYVAYRELKSAVQANGARAGSLVILDTQTGEVMALVNRPSVNPNNRSDLKDEHYRNRAITDLFEPGSTIKPFTIAAALESGIYTPDSIIDTSPGIFKIGSHDVTDEKNYGRLDLGGILEKSSNIGASKIALSLDPELLWQVFRDCGFGSLSEVMLPGEANGRLKSYPNWRQLDQGVLAYGYGVSVTAIQLARAYMSIANDGLIHPVQIVRTEDPPQARRAIKRSTARAVRNMLIRVVEHGTAKGAAIPGYSVAGKTGTVYKHTGKGYADNQYMAIFVGMVPARRPRLVAAVVIDEPDRGEYFGGQVAAPIFGSVMREATRILNIAPDYPLSSLPSTTDLALRSNSPPPSGFH